MPDSNQTTESPVFHAHGLLMGVIMVAATICSSFDAASAQSVHIDSGSPTPTTTSDGNTYSADPSPGSELWDYATYANLCSDGAGNIYISGTPDPLIYRAVRYGSSFTYSIPIADGCYDVTTYFAECKFNSTGHRLTRIDLNGRTLLSGLDIFADVGPATKDRRVFLSNNITGGIANLTFTSQVTTEDAIVSSLAITPGTGCISQQIPIRHILMIMFENARADQALQTPYFGGILPYAAYLNQMFAVTHPSQPNYIAMVAGSTFGMTDDNNHDLSVSHLGDLLEAQGLDWRVYAEDYPGNCYTGTQSGNYVRKHNPLISFTNVNGNTSRCNAHIVNAGQFWVDQQNRQLPAFSLYVPNLQNDGHDTDVYTASNWVSEAFGPLLNDSNFMADTLVILTFDEDDTTGGNLIYTSLLGDHISNGAVSNQQYNHYSLLRLIESTFGLGNLGRSDASAVQINDIWN